MDKSNVKEGYQADGNRCQISLLVCLCGFISMDTVF